MSRELSNDTDAALEQIAAGWGREPTVAHPDCLCGGRAQFSTVRYRELGGKIWVLRSWGVKTIKCPVHRRTR